MENIFVFQESMKAFLSKRREITPGTWYAEFSTEEEINFRAGQVFSVTLINPPFTDQRGNRRIFGFVNNPEKNLTAALITRNGPSAFKKSLLKMCIGGEAEIDDISGNMTLPENTDVPIVIIAGGIGIAPYISIFREIKNKKLPYKITLIDANTNMTTAIFWDELAAITKENPNIKLITTLTDGAGLSEEIIRENLQTGAVYYVSGTPRFVPTIVRILKKSGILPGQIKFEIFTGY
jgi:ferredoxin-NADP reductase